MGLSQILTIASWSICVIEFVALFFLLRKKAPNAVQSTNRFFQFISKMLSEANGGGPSSMRFNLTNMAVQWVTVISFGFIWTVLKHPELMLAYLGLILAALEASLGIKVFQKKIENSPDDNSVDTEQTPKS